jgi:GH35 family endo-1,4-beta-xylanase
MTNLDMPQNLDGISLKPQIEGENNTSKIFAVSQYPRRSKASGETMGYSFRSERYRYTVWVKNKKSTEPISNDDIYAEELYDYKTDPNETENKASLENYQRIKTQFVKLANGFFNSQISEKPTVVKSNVISQNIMTNDRSNSWADKRSKIIGNYIAGEMLMNKNQKEFIIDVLYSKYARNNNLTANNNLTDNQIETIYKETFSVIKDILLEKFTKKQVDSILKYESEKLSTPKEKNNISAISSPENESFLVGSTLIHRELSSNYANLFLKDFKYLTAMNAAKQSNINPTKGSWKWNQIDNFAKFSKDNNLLFRLHSPIGPQCSKWIKDDARTADELQASLDEFLFRLLDRYKDFDNIKWIDVVNETILASGKWLGSKPGNSKWENPWLDIGLDENGYPLYIIRAFELADKYAPNKKLVYNQNGGMQIPMWEKLKETVMYLKSKGQRVDGIGWQGHLMNNNGLKQFVENLDEELKKLSDLIDWAHSNKLEFHITELDYYNDGENNIFNSVKKQAEVYQKLMDLLQEKSKNGLVTVNFWSMGERISSRGKKGHYMSIYDNDTIPTKTYEVVKKFINFD